MRRPQPHPLPQDRPIRNLLALLALALLVFAGVGYYKEWYTLKWLTGADGHTTIAVDLDKKKVENDLNAGKEKVVEVIQGKK